MLKSMINPDAAGKNTLGFMLIMLLALSTSLFAQNNALDFDGTDDYVSVAHNASLNVESSFTIECWFYTDNNTDEKILLEKGTWDGSWLFFLKPDAGNLKIALASSSWTNINLLGTTTLSSGKWYHFAATWDGTTRKVYLNGNEENSDTPTGDPTSNSEALTIGDRTGGGSSFDGKIDEVRIWDDVRTQTEIADNMNIELEGNEANLVAYYKLNEGSGQTANDSAGENDGTLGSSTGSDSADPTWTAASDLSLPVELAAFTAENQSGGVLLTWTTESEIENLGFILSRRLKAQSLKWAEIASYLTSDALEGHGSTTQLHAYRYTDTTVEPGATYEYRLGDVDYSGNVIWHDAVEITIPVADAAIPATFGLQKAYPNPFNPAVTLQYDLIRDGETILQVYNVRGQLVATPLSMFQTAGSYAFTWQPQNLNTGVYVVRLQSGKQHALQKVIFIK